MPRKAYLDDLLSASHAGEFGNISRVTPGGDDGEFTFVFNFAVNEPHVEISALIPDLSEYPKSHDYHIFASEDAPPAVATALEQAPNFTGKPLSALLFLLSRFLTDRTRSGGPSNPLEIDSDGDTNMPDSQFDGEFDGDSDSDRGDNEDWALDFDDALEGGRLAAHLTNATATTTHVPITALAAARARADLRIVKAAGFKVGHLGNVKVGNSCCLSIAIRIAKLGISEEAMTAWGLEPSTYFTLLLYYPTGYKSLEFLEHVDAFIARQNVQMRTGISTSYKPKSFVEAKLAFKSAADVVSDPVGATNSHHDQTSEGQTDDDAGFRQHFISRPLDELLNNRFIPILRYRLGMGLSWAGAEKHFNESQGRENTHTQFLGPAYSMDEEVSATLPKIVTDDEIRTPKARGELSFPLITMQFLLRHFVSCTSFCLVCHCKLETQMEAIKPYVCESGLCLYQYMTLGFGPSIEHEIITQPYVVDLLISFCYASIRASSLHTFPEGLGLMVPDPSLPLQQWQSSIIAKAPTLGSMQLPGDQIGGEAASSPSAQNGQVLSYETQSYQAKIDQHALEVLFDQTIVRCPCRRGDWIAINVNDSPAWHCRVTETNFFPTISISEPAQVGAYKRESNQDKSKIIGTRPKGWRNINLHVYKENFDGLANFARYSSMQLLLDLLPSVTEMRNYLLSKPGVSLASWVDKIPPAGLGLLRWIVASNRSMIVQVDDPQDQQSSSRPKCSESRVEGVQGWLQFRFAMGAPDKEQRFVNAINQHTASSSYPTLFAWHGSPLANWHSIVRESLNFNTTAHGRAYGHGCYFARDFQTSSGYASMIGGGEVRMMPGAWPQSILQVSAALALSEIVNAPAKFVSQSPYYVVQHCDWIQTRYLFVQPIAQIAIQDFKLDSILKQDPAHTPLGSSRTPIVLPLTAIPRSRRPKKFAGDPVPSPLKKRAKLSDGTLKVLTSSTEVDDDVLFDYDGASVVTDVEDLELLFEPEPERPISPPLSTKGKRKTHAVTPVTSFYPKKIENLPVMAAPAYATSTATKRLQKDFRMLLETQQAHISTNTLVELGWYTDPLGMDNLYQWVVELHSFPLSLPLAADLKASGMQSVVLEIRFHASYPMTPPFVRVVRPRFLPFQAGGGGHVTAGGSICMDLLTNSGWSAVSNIESVLLQIRMAIMSTDPRPAKLEHGGNGAVGMDYGVGEAMEAFKRACRAHGWVVPEGLEAMASAG